MGRAGSPWGLKCLLIEIVQSLKPAPGPVGQQYQKLLRSKGKAKATVAAARKARRRRQPFLRSPEWATSLRTDAPGPSVRSGA